MLIVLNFLGDLEGQGFQILGEVHHQDRIIAKERGYLPADPTLVYWIKQHWHNYRQVCAPYERMRGIQPVAIDSGVDVPGCQESGERLCDRLGHWLESPTFQAIERLIIQHLRFDEEDHCVLTTEDRCLYQLPWHKWHPEMLVTFGPLNFHQVYHTYSVPCEKILGILGHSEGINIEKDSNTLRDRFRDHLTLMTEATPEKNTQHQTINDRLWEESWDIIFFAGHSETVGDKGRIYLNSRESLTLDQLEYGMKQAVKKGLQLVIFNSCDGVGLIHQLAACQIPYIIVMRELIPDQVAQAFVTYFLDHFSQGDGLFVALQKAQKRLQGLESDFPCASWLPLVYQTPHASPLRWKPSKKTSLVPRRCLIAASVATVMIMGLRWLGGLQGLELMVYDRMMQSRRGETIDKRLTVVEITSEDTNEYGYPLPDGILAKAIANVRVHQPAVIGVDIHRHQPQGEGGEALIRLFNESDVIPVCAFDTEDKHYTPSQGVTSSSFGFSNLIIDEIPLSGNKVRRHLLSYNPNLDERVSLCTTPYSFSWLLAYQYLQQQNIGSITTNADNNWQFGEIAFTRLPSRFAAYQGLDGKSSQIMINYRSQLLPGKRLTLSQVLNKPLASQWVEDKIILLGYRSSTAKDSFNTPLGELPGVWVHGHATSQMINTVLEGRWLIWAFPQWGDLLIVFFASTMTGMIIFTISHVSRLRFKVYVEILSVIIVSITLYFICLSCLEMGLWLPFLPILLGIWGVIIITKVFLI
ncbi:MAG: CHASE2 domain-containing protein [Crocosphaera sp.]